MDGTYGYTSQRKWVGHVKLMKQAIPAKCTYALDKPKLEKASNIFTDYTETLQQLHNVCLRHVAVDLQFPPIVPDAKKKCDPNGS
ncbi:hypothetical protein KIN20_025710 [Parelaphostrongylus tenuis]|uniref:Uncharacterized protein n=1 Tax=Parelaphostrongylus tenuis TaxID=148309 RepID=A0AAD5NC20_PARTN|nr:hypothetical protein KIN20_025710 [Parelaphostrongylus tenuis]